jgi:hypothetical protein
MKRNINSHIVQFLQGLTSQPSTVKDMAQEVGDYFQREYQNDVAAGYNAAPPAGQIALGFFVAGYDSRSIVGELWQVLIPGPNIQKQRDSNSPGASWNGQTDAVLRLIKGFDPRIAQLPNFTTALAPQLGNLEYATPFEAMPLQDGVDYAIFLIRTTIDMQRFQFGIGGQLGSIPAVGGAIDIGIIEPNKEFRFLQKKELRGERGTI